MNERKPMVSLYQVVRTMSVEYKRWIFSTKMLLLVFLVVYTKQQLVEPLLELTDRVDGTLQILEPSIAFMGSSSMFFILPVLYLLVMGNYPRKDADTAFVFVRIGRKGWFLGQVLFSLAAAFTVLCFMLIFTTLWCVGRLQWHHGIWSNAVTRYYQETGNDFKFNLITGNIYNQMHPVPAFIHSFVLVFLLLVLLSQIQMFCSMVDRPLLGIGVSGVIATIGNGLAVLNLRPMMWFFPIAHTQIRLRHELLFDGESMPLYLSYLYFMISIVVLTLISWIMLKRKKRLL